MKFGIEVVPIGPYSDPRNVVELAKAADAVGWEAIWVWDHVLFPYGIGDPWITLAAVAEVTSHLHLCTGISPIPRYRPHLLARLLAGLDILSQGRVIFGTGLGVASDFKPFGEEVNDKIHAEMTDEGLEVLTKMLSGNEFSYAGKYYSANTVQLIPAAIQKPRIPIWIGGDSLAALRRAARWDGWIINTINEQQEITKPPEQIAFQASYIQNQRQTMGSFDIAVDGISNTNESGLAKEYEHAGATWWFESVFGTRGSLDEMLKRVKAGPPKI
jgi:alkanesulfonate monooxygenase SsuD/methylene tetrahydromethanopterin reductase-like flavin-dependent oxidoreductase (luciferase family)